MTTHSLDNARENTREITGKSEQILWGAMQVFLHHGYAGTSMDRVAAQAGVSKHTIYHHFQGKDGLFSALFERLVMRDFHVEFGYTLSLQDPPEQVLRRLADVLLRKMDDSEYIAFVRLLFAESGRFPKLSQLYMREVCQKGDAVLGEYLRHHPDLHLVDPEMTAHIFFGSLVAFIFSQEVLHGKVSVPLERDRLVNTLIQLVLNSSRAE